MGLGEKGTKSFVFNDLPSHWPGESRRWVQYHATACTSEIYLQQS
jgi:hypothetical protein